MVASSTEDKYEEVKLAAEVIEQVELFDLTSQNKCQMSESTVIIYKQHKSPKVMK